MSRINISINAEEKNIWDNYKNQLLEDFTLIYNNNFWKKISLTNNNEKKIFDLYKKLKLLLRFEIIKNLKETFKNKINLVGNDWTAFHFNSLPSNYNIRKIKSMYKGNICLDLGSIEGSISLYPRSIQIIESGGLIIQSIQSDSKKIWNNIHNKILFNNLQNLISLIEKILNDKKYCVALLRDISENFRHSDKSIEKSLDEIFKR